MGDPTELYERPVNRFVANFIGVSNPIAGHGHRARPGDAAGRGRDATGASRCAAGHRPDGRPVGR